MAFGLALGVTPERLKSKAFDVSDSIEGIAREFQRMREEIDSTAGYWKGDAGDLQRRSFAEKADEIENLLTRLRTYPPRITQMAGIYISAEEYNRDRSTSLRTDIEML